jgi:hypothetical protein
VITASVLILLALRGLLSLPLAIGLAVNRNDLGVMREPINQGDGTRGIRKDRVPLLKRQGRGGVPYCDITAGSSLKVESGTAQRKESPRRKSRFTRFQMTADILPEVPKVQHIDRVLWMQAASSTETGDARLGVSSSNAYRHEIPRQGGRKGPALAT